MARLVGCRHWRVVFALGVRFWASYIRFVFSVFVLGTIYQEFWRGAVMRRKSTGTDLFTAPIGLVAGTSGGMAATSCMWASC